MNLADTNAILLTCLNALIPYDLANHRLASGVCPSCATKLRHHRHIDTERLAALIDRTPIRLLRVVCCKETPCDICRRVMTSDSSSASMFKENQPPPNAAALLIETPPPRKRRRTLSPRPPTYASLDVDDYAALKSCESGSTKGTARIANVLRERHPNRKLPTEFRVRTQLTRGSTSTT